MAFDSRASYCKLSGPPAPAAPYAPQSCFEVPYVPNYSNNNSGFSQQAMGCNTLSCQPNGQIIGACQFSEECGVNGVCDTGVCWNRGQAHNPSWYSNGNPRVVADIAWENVEQMFNSMGLGQQFKQIADTMAYGKSMFVVEYKGQQHIAVPLNTVYFRQEPQCGNCLRTLWQCDRFEDAARNGDAQSALLYQKCQQYRDVFFYDTMNLQGIVIPIMVKVDPESLQVARAALQKCNQHCGDYSIDTPMSRGEDVLFY